MALLATLCVSPTLLAARDEARPARIYVVPERGATPIVVSQTTRKEDGFPSKHTIFTSERGQWITYQAKNWFPLADPGSSCAFRHALLPEFQARLYIFEYPIMMLSLNEESMAGYRAGLGVPDGWKLEALDDPQVFDVAYPPLNCETWVFDYRIVSDDGKRSRRHRDYLVTLPAIDGQEDAVLVMKLQGPEERFPAIAKSFEEWFCSLELDRIQQ